MPYLTPQRVVNFVHAADVRHGPEIVAYQQVEAYLIYPKIMTRSVEIPGSVTVIAALIGAGAEHYALEIQGDSMVEAGILDGDYALVRADGWKAASRTAVPPALGTSQMSPAETESSATRRSTSRYYWMYWALLKQKDFKSAG